MCGYDLHPIVREIAAWQWKYDDGFILTDDSRVRGKSMFEYAFAGCISQTSHICLYVYMYIFLHWGLVNVNVLYIYITLKY